MLFKKLHAILQAESLQQQSPGQRPVVWIPHESHQPEGLKENWLIKNDRYYTNS